MAAGPAGHLIDRIDVRWKNEAKKEQKDYRSRTVKFLIVSFLLLHFVVAPAFLWFMYLDWDAVKTVYLAMSMVMPIVYVITICAHWFPQRFFPTTLNKFDWWENFDNGDTLVDSIVEAILEKPQHYPLPEEELVVVRSLIAGANKELSEGGFETERKKQIASQLFEMALTRAGQLEVSILPLQLTTRESMF